MAKQADITFQDDKFLVSGDLNVVNVMSVYQKSLGLLQHSSEWVFDFSQLHACDSAALALMVEWIKFAKTMQKRIAFLHISDDLLSIAKAAGMDGMLGARRVD